MGRPSETNVLPARVDARQRLVDLYNSAAGDLHRYCLARAGDRATADDAVSEAFLAAARALRDQPETQIDRAWLFVVAKRRLVDVWRGDERQVRRLERLRNDRSSPAHQGVGAERCDQSEQVLAALQTLPRRQRAALTLRYLDDCSVAEVAETLGCGYQAAESLLARGRRGFTSAWFNQRGTK